MEHVGVATVKWRVTEFQCENQSHGNICHYGTILHDRELYILPTELALRRQARSLAFSNQDRFVELI